MPSVTTTQRHKANADPVIGAHVVLLEFLEDGTSNPQRAVLDNQDLTHNGDVYSATGMVMNLPSSGNQIPTVRLDVSNIDRVIGSALADAKNLIGCRIRVVDVTFPDVAIIDSYNLFVLRKARVGDRVVGTLGSRGLNEPVPGQRTSRPLFPGVWINSA